MYSTGQVQSCRISKLKWWHGNCRTLQRPRADRWGNTFQDSASNYGKKTCPIDVAYQKSYLQPLLYWGFLWDGLRARDTGWTAAIIQQWFNCCLSASSITEQREKDRQIKYSNVLLLIDKKLSLKNKGTSCNLSNSCVFV